MTTIEERLRCPKCGGRLTVRDVLACSACDARFASHEGFLDFLSDASPADAEARVDSFYERFPFPGYAPSDDATTILARCGATHFLSALDASLSTTATVLDAGCGTGQIAAYLALCSRSRRVVGVDRCRASLAAAAEFRTRADVDNLTLVRGSLFDLPLAEGAFDVVISRGVIHHTPDPERALEHVAHRVAMGGFLILGFYETAARLVHRARRRLYGTWPKTIDWLDPVLRRRDVSDEKKRIWIADQYEHPLEHTLRLPDVLASLDRLGLTWVRTLPPSVRERDLFTPTPRPSATGLAWRRAGWALSGLRDPDAGLVCVVAQRR